MLPYQIIAPTIHEKIIIKSYITTNLNAKSKLPEES